MNYSSLIKPETQHQKINLFKNLFRGRDDCYGEGKGLCIKEPVSDAVIKAHLSGFKRIGIYMLTGNDKDSVYFSVMDFDNDEKEQNPISRLGDALEYYNSCKSYELNSYIEASKTNGCYHVWHFFSEPVSALKIRRLMMQVISDTNIKRFEIFPKQDKTETYGNYINLPLFKTNLPTNTAFIDETTQPIKDQWLFLTSIIRNTQASIDDIIAINKINLSNNGHNPASENQEKWITEAMKGSSSGNRTVTLVKLISYYAKKKIPKDIILEMMLQWDKNNKPTLTESYGKDKIPDTVNDILNRYYAGGITENETIDVVEKNATRVIAEKPYKPFFLTDYGNAERLVYWHGDNLQYCEAKKTWFVWNGQYWKPDDSLETDRLAKNTIRRIYTEAGQCENDIQRKAISTHARNSEANSKIQAMIALAKSEKDIIISAEELDTNAFLLNCQNGTVDLRTGELLPHNRKDEITKIIPVVYDKMAECPRWMRFLDEVFIGNKDLIRFVQYALGYSLTGSIQERCMFIAYGNGANGKSKFLDTIEYILGDYSRHVEPSTFALKREEAGGAREDIARLCGTRFVSSIETSVSHRLNEELIKKMTGDRLITTRNLYEKSFEFEQTYKMWLATNNRPIIKGTDDGIWDRIRMIPFERKFLPEEQDSLLYEKLIAEASGILYWIIEGCLLWQGVGLHLVTPDKVMNANTEYRSDMNTIQAFIDDCCAIEDKAFVTSKELYQLYVEWCLAGGERPESQKMLGSRLQGLQHGIVSKKIDNKRTWVGIRAI
jgi:putative DNA primase/helicase